jgi:hypothetical protein
MEMNKTAPEYRKLQMKVVRFPKMFRPKSSSAGADTECHPASQTFAGPSSYSTMIYIRMAQTILRGPYDDDLVDIRA